MTLTDLNEIDRHYWPALCHIRDCQDDASLAQLDLPFATSSASGRQVPLSAHPDQVRITRHNRHLYLQSALNYRLHEFDGAQIRRFNLFLFVLIILFIHCSFICYSFVIHSFSFVIHSFSFVIHALFIRYSFDIHSLFILYPFFIHLLFIHFSFVIHSLFIRFSLVIHSLFIRYSFVIHSVRSSGGRATGFGPRCSISAALSVHRMRTGGDGVRIAGDSAAAAQIGHHLQGHRAALFARQVVLGGHGRVQPTRAIAFPPLRMGPDVNFSKILKYYFKFPIFPNH